VFRVAVANLAGFGFVAIGFANEFCKPSRSLNTPRRYQTHRFMFEQAFKNIDNVLWKETAMTNHMGMMGSMGFMKSQRHLLFFLS